MAEVPRAEYAAQAGSFSAAIHVGRLNKARTAFLDKQERTDIVLAAVAQYVQRHFDGGMTADFPDLDLVLDVRVSPRGGDQ